jgi:hypothetical protein
LSRAERALERVAAQPLDELGAADDDPACGPPSSLSPEKQTMSAPRRGSPRGRLVAERESAPEPRSSTSGSRRRARPRRARERGCSVKPTTRKFDWCTRRSSAVSGRSRARSPPRGAVRRSHLDHARARPGENVRDPEAVADLDQLAARDDDLPSLRERRDREEDGGGVVVDDERSLGARQPAKRVCDVGLARPARARLEVELEVRVGAADLLDARQCRLRERRAPEVRVDDHAGGVQHALQRGCFEPLELCPRERSDVTGVAARADRPAGVLERRPRGRECERAGRAGSARPPAGGRPTGASREGSTDCSLGAADVSAGRPREQRRQASAPGADDEHVLVVDRLRQHAGGRVRDAREARQRMPMCRAASTSGTVDIPTRSAPRMRIIRISAGVSNAGPSQAA